MSDYESILLETDGPLGLLTLNKAARHNAFDADLIAEITLGLLELEEAASVRVVVISALGSSFCAGADLAWMKKAAHYTQEDNRRDAEHLSLMLATLNDLSKPTIARVQGPAYGGGVGLIAACDLAVATYDTAFALSEVKLGLIPAVISPYILAAIGERHARRYMLTAERFSAAEAYRIGLVHELVSDAEQLDNAINELADRLLAGGPVAQTECKQLIRVISGQPIDDETRAETVDRISRVRASDEGQEGLAAFLAKRRPSWLAD